MTRRFALRLAAGLALAAAAAAAGGLLWLRTSVPDLSGSARVAGLRAPVEIIHDGNGVPHVHAASADDAYAALGFVHARDRLFQMDFMRRLGAGRLSEVVGPPTLRIDRLMRTLGLHGLAGETYARLPDDARRHLDSYAAGVNAFLAGRRGALPPEFVLLDYAPEPWTPPDSLVWGRLMAQTLTGNWRTEALRAALAGRLPPERLEDLWPREAGGPAPTLAARPEGLPPAAAFAALLRAVPGILGQRSASNSWAVSGARTASGMPLLANDPHLRFRAPGLWYLARVKAPGLDLAGATVAGVPFHVLGHNDRVAWAFTTTDSDTQDLFVERLSAGREGHYDAPDGPRPFAVRTETIRIRGREPVAHVVRETVHGPVISDVDDRLARHLPEDRVVALASAGLRPDDLTPLAILGINRARDWTGFRRALRHFHAPQQNVTYADVAGNIGFVAPGRVPVRRGGDGGLPAEGWTGARDWTGFVPFDQLPQALNPPSGLIANANHRVVPDDYPWLLARDWGPPYRAIRILEVLGRPGLRTPEAEAALQQDVASRAATAVLPLLLARAAPADARGRRAVALLRRWNGEMSPELAAPLIFVSWLAETERALYADELGEQFAHYRGLRPRVVRHMLLNRPGWCDDVATPGREDCGAAATRALASALDRLAGRFGDDMARWRWGEAHVALFRHPVFGRLPLLRDLADIRVEIGGGPYTVNRGQNRLSDEKEPFASVHGAGYRAVYDLSDLSRSLFAVATGPSGNFLSPRYDNTTRDWRDGRYLRLARTRAGALRNAAGVLRLAPAP